MKKTMLTIAAMMTLLSYAEQQDQNRRRHLEYIADNLQEPLSRELMEAFTIVSKTSFDGDQKECWYNVMQVAMDRENEGATNIALQQFMNPHTKLDFKKDQENIKSTAKVLTETIAYAAATSFAFTIIKSLIAGEIGNIEIPHVDTEALVKAVVAAIPTKEAIVEGVTAAMPIK